jgi:hypothetical protein
MPREKSETVLVELADVSSLAGAAQDNASGGIEDCRQGSGLIFRHDAP